MAKKPAPNPPEIDPIAIAQEAAVFAQEAKAVYGEVIKSMKFRAKYLKKKGHVETPAELLRLASVLSTHARSLAMLLDDKIKALVGYAVTTGQKLVDLQNAPPTGGTLPPGTVPILQESADAINAFVPDSLVIPSPPPTHGAAGTQTVGSAAPQPDPLAEG